MVQHCQSRHAFGRCLFTLSLFGVLNAQTPPPPLSGGEIYKEFARSVVRIEQKNEKGDGGWVGTGFIVAADGKILTNYHVIRNSKEATVRLADGDVYDTVEVLDVDPRKDIALLKIKAIDLSPVKIGHSNSLQIGDVVYSLSNPLGLLDNTLSEGIISSVRQMDGYRLLQITAPISHGSSGGPLFNTKGEVIGITTSTITQGQSLNFAIMIDYARGMLASPSSARPLASVYDPEPQRAAEPSPPANRTESGTSGNDSGNKVGGAVDGSWSASFADGKASGHLEFNLIQNSDGQVVGTYTSSSGGGGQIKGIFAEREFRFELTQSIQNCPGIFKGSGALGDGRTSITGAYTGTDCLGDRGKGTFVMTKVTTTEPVLHPTSSAGFQIPPGTSLGEYLASRLLAWTEQDGRTAMGEPMSHRYAYDQAQNITGDIYSYRSPNPSADHIELLFDSKTKRMTNVYLYPVRVTWADCKKLWGDNVAVKKNPDGNKFYMYKDRRVNVLLDKNNKVVSLGLY
jgi:S1-C subfamily serine protease